MRKIASSLAALALALAAPLLATDFYVAPDGVPSGNGSREKPWDLATALAQPSAVKPGDTIWLRGGTYRGHFTSTLKGNANKPVVVRQYGSERATLDGNDGTNAVTLLVNGSDTWFWGFEITNSNTTRTSSNTSPPGGRGEAVNLLGARTRLINLQLHDTNQGVLTTTDIPDTEVSGCLIYYNGYDGTDRGHGHGIYIANAAPSTKRVVDNVIFDQFGYGIHAYTQGGKLDGLYFEGNTSFNNGALAQVTGLTTDILVGASGSAAANPTDSDKVAKNTTLRSNFTYFSSSGGTGANLGYSKGIASPTIVDNYLVGGAALTLINAFRPITMTGNSLYGSISGFQSSEFPGNTYYASRPTGMKVFVRPNQYEPGRANITVYNWDKASIVDVSLIGVLNPGMHYEVRSAQNFFGAPVLTGIYNGAPIHIPMTGLTPATPVGRPAPAATGPDFQVFVLLPKAPPPAARLRVVRPSATPRSPVTLARTEPRGVSTAAFISNGAAYSSARGAARIQYFPGVARFSSAGSSSSRNEVAIANRGSDPATVTLRFLEHDRDNTSAPAKSFVLAPQETLRADDALMTLFGANETYGTLEVEADGAPGISVFERAPADPGTAGPTARQLAAVFEEDLAPTSLLVGLRQDTESRSDVGLLNPNAGGAAVSLTLLLPPTTVLGTTFVLVPPRGYVRHSLATLFPSVALPAGENLSVVVDAGALPVYAFASVIDDAPEGSAFNSDLR
jgi:hypothetical protein